MNDSLFLESQATEIFKTVTYTRRYVTTEVER